MIVQGTMWIVVASAEESHLDDTEAIPRENRLCQGVVGWMTMDSAAQMALLRRLLPGAGRSGLAASDLRREDK